MSGIFVIFVLIEIAIMEISKEIIIEGNKSMAVFLGYTYYPFNEKEKIGDGFNAKSPKGGWRGEDEKILSFEDLPKLKAIKYLCRSHHELPFYRDWFQLMRVVEKIESIFDDHHGYFSVLIVSNSCTIQGTKLPLALKDTNYGFVYYDEAFSDTKFKSVWIACYGFLKWYNANFI